jgi:acyl transferase domain-containing protein/NADPH:quinone reductase-like Zn-dependent oxidoreductase/short-subunit dehydrogenase
MPTDPKQSENRERLKNAVLAIQTLQAQLASARSGTREPIAVIGMSCRFPGGAIDPESYWQLLRDGRNGICEIPGWRWPVDEFYSDDPNQPGKMYVRRGGFVDGIENFDADFFGISAREALRLDPQQRLLLEVAWQALEDAAIAPDSLAGSNTGVFVGITSQDYDKIVRAAGNDYLDAYKLTGSCLNFGPGRIAYFLGLQGPALAIDTACSSSLVAFDSACRSLRTGQCDLALACGANALLIPDGFVSECKARMLSPDGFCKTFDAAANGFARGEGAAAVVLKRLADAQADGDRILAVILGSAVNQDGKSSGLTVPNRHAQEAVIRKALEFAGVAPSEIQYVEAHGTATPLGDPIEVRALANVFGKGRPLASPLYLGSVKTNIGHLESAAGMAGLIKVILALRHREIPPHLNLRNLTSHVEWNQIPVRVCTDLTAWPEGAPRRIAGVSSFGASGTNCHVVVAEAPGQPAPATVSQRPLHLLTVSARTEFAMRAAAMRLADYLRAQPDAAIEDVCRTANTGRAHFAHRLSVLCANTTQAHEKLRGCLTASLPAGAMISHLAGFEHPSGTGAASSARETNPGDQAESMEKLQAQYHAGAAIDWEKVDQHLQGRKMSLPTYPFERERFWIEPARSAQTAASGPHISSRECTHPLLGLPLNSPAIDGRIFEAHLDAYAPAFLQDHRICGRVILPAAGFVEMALAGARQFFGQSPYSIQDLELQEMLPLTAGTPTTVQTILRPVGRDTISFQIYSASRNSADPGTAWTRHAACTLVNANPARLGTGSASDIAALRSRCNEPASIDALYERLADQGIEFGAAFRNLRALFRGDGESLAEVQLTAGSDSESASFQFHPALLDACFQAAAESIVFASRNAVEDEVLLPVGIEGLRIMRDIPSRLWCHSRLNKAVGNESRTSVLDLDIFDQNGMIVASVTGLKLKWVDRSVLGERQRVNATDWLYEIQWREIPQHDKAFAGSLGRPGTWLILADARGRGEALQLRLSTLGHTCILARHGSAFRSCGKNNFELNPTSPADFVRVVEESNTSPEMPLRGAIHLWNLDAAAEGEVAIRDLEFAQALSCGAALHLVQALALSKSDTPPELYLVTRGAQAPASSPAAPRVETASLCGLAKVIAEEHPELQCRRIDLDPETRDAADDAKSLFDFLCGVPGEDEIAVRRNTVLAPRLVHVSSVNAAPGLQDNLFAQLVRLEIAEAGMIENLSWNPVEPNELKADEIEIEVGAAGLNFRDVLCALGMYPGNAVRLGGECAGTVTRVGSNVQTIRRGEMVMALAPGGLATHVNVRADYAAQLPAGISVAEAASLPVAFLTTLFGLHHLGRMKSGDRVLIHAAAGGVGLAAVQLAQRAGAEIFATAGSPEKREYLRRLGVPHIYDSRSIEFANEIRRDTNGRGVNLVLNSLAGEFIQKSISALAAGGRFVELGKRGILTRDEFIANRPDCEYYAFDLGEEAYKDPSLLPALYAELRSAFEKKTLHPLPIKFFDPPRVVDAFRFMAQARHTGKIVLTDPARYFGRRSSGATFRILSEETYLVTGGFGGLGLESARWLAREGARNLVLIGRREPSPEVRTQLDELAHAGVRITVKVCDVADEAQLATAFAEIANSMPPLRGVIHAAGVLDDGVLTGQSWPRFERVMAPKIYGAWNLHRLTASSDLDFFVLFSSVAGIIGSPGQGNYAAANAFMDALAHRRRATGLAALSVDWGTWAEAGMAARLESVDAQRLKDRGLQSIRLEQGFAKLGEMIGLGRAQIVAMHVDWSRFLRAGAPGHNNPYFAEVAETPFRATEADEPAAAEGDVVRRIIAEPVARRLPMLQAYVESIARNALGVRAGKSVDPRQPLHDLGLDSLMAVELRNALAAPLKRHLPATLAFDHPTIESLTLYLAKEILHLDIAQDVADGEASKTTNNDLSDLKHLTDAEAEALLVVELDRTRELANE